MKLRRIGFFRELKHGLATGPSLRDSVRGTASPDLDRIAAYLRGAPVLIACPGLVTDVLKEPQEIVGSPHIKTDGVWAWPDDLTYYVVNYNVELPRDFVEHMKENRWQPPEIGRDQLAGFQLEP